MKKIYKRGKRILAMALVFAIVCTSLPCVPAIPAYAAQNRKNGTWYEVSARINASWGGHVAGEITLVNVSSQTRQDWQIAFPWQAQITSMWNGRYEETSSGYLITPMEYNRELAPEASVSVGFTAEGDDSELSRLGEDGFFREEGAGVTDAEERENGTPDPTAGPTASPTAEPTASPTAEPTASPTAEPTASPMAEPTASPTAEPTASPTAEPTASPTVEPTASPTAEPTASPTAEPTASPTAEPAATLEPAGDLYIYTDTVIQEDTVCGSLFLMGGSLECSGHSITVQKDYFQNGKNCRLSASELDIAGSMRMTGGSLSADQDSMVHVGGDFDARNAESITHKGGAMVVGGAMAVYGGDHTLQCGKLQAGSLRLEDVDNFYLHEMEVTVGGDLDCDITKSWSQYSGSTEVGGNLTVHRGQYYNHWAVESRVQGDLRILEEGKLNLDIDSESSMEVCGDVLLDSQEKSVLGNGKLRIHGDLVQTEGSAEDSLAAGERFTLEFCGEERQKLDIAHPETATLGILDFRSSPGIETGSLIRGSQVWDLAKIGRKERLCLELSSMRMVQDEFIDCGTLEWRGNLEGKGYDFTVSGGMAVHGGNHTLQCGKLQTGSLRLEDVDNFYLHEMEVTVGGDLDCDITKSWSQHSGSTEVSGNLTVHRGQYYNHWAVESRVQGDLRILEEGKLNLDIDSGSSMEVCGDVLLDSQEKSVLGNGKLRIHGDLVQTEESAENSLEIGGGFTLACCGSTVQSIDLPGVDEIPNLDLRQSRAVSLENDYEGVYLDGLEKIVPKNGVLYSYYEYNTVTADTVLDADFHCGGNLDLGHYALTVHGDFRQKGQVLAEGAEFTVRGSYTAVKGLLYLGNSTVYVGGNMSIRQDAGLCFLENQPSHLAVDGNFSTASGNGVDNRFASGTLEVRGNLTQQAGAGGSSLRMDQTRLVLSGNGRQTVTLQDTAGKDYFHDVDLTESTGVEFVCEGLKAGNITGMEHITNELLTLWDSRLALQQDEMFGGELALADTYLDCNGYRLHTGGALTQADSIVNLDGGALHVDKDYHIIGSSILQMIRPEDRVYVGGSFATASSMNHSSMLRDGRMEVMGGFDQSGDVNSFASSEDFVIAFLGSGTHKAHFMEEQKDDQYFANVDPYYSDVEYVNDSISVTTAALHIGIGMAEGLAEIYLDPAMAAVVGAFLAAYGISVALIPANYVVIGVELVSVAMVVLSVYSMLKAGDELGEALNGDYSEKEKAELFGKAAVMMILSAVGMYGALELVTQPEMLRSIVTESKAVIGKKFSEVKSLAGILHVKDADSLLSYCEEFISSPAEAYLQEAAQGKNVRQLHELAKMIREASGKIERMLTQDELAAAVENWQRTGSIKEAVQAVVDWIKLNQLAAKRKDLKYKGVNIHGKKDTELDEVDLDNQIIFEDKDATKLYMENPDYPQTEQLWARKQIFDKGYKRIDAINQEKYTLSIKGSTDLPDINQLKSIRKYVFVIDADTQALRQAVGHSLDMLRWKYPEYEFWAIYGGK